VKVTVEYLGALSGHNDWITSLVVGQQGNRPLLVSGSRDKSLIVWDLDLEGGVSTKEGVEERYIGKPLKSMKGHNHFVSSLAITSDNKYVLSGSWDKTLRLWDLNTNKTKQVFVGHTKDVLSCSFSSDMRIIYSGGMDKTVKIWNVQGKNQYTSNDFNGWVSCLTNIRQGKEGPLIAVGSWDSKVRIFDKDFKLIKGIGSIDYPVVSMSTDDDGEFLFVGEKNGSIKIWGLNAGENQADEMKQQYDIQTDLYAINYEHKYFGVFSIGSANGLTVKEISEGKDVFNFTYGKNVACQSLAFDPSKKYLFAGFTDGIIRVYKFST